MNLPNWFRIAWWLALLGVITRFLYLRRPDLIAGHASPADVVVFLIWVALALAPVFEEVDFFGLKFKQRLEEIKGELGSLRSEIKNAVDVRNSYAPNITLFPQIPIDRLDEFAEEIKRRAQEKLGVKTVPEPPSQATGQGVPGHLQFLFNARFSLEKEIRRLYQSRVVHDPGRRFVPLSHMTRALLQAEVIDKDSAVAAEELYRLASRAIHGEPIEPPQVKFAHDVAGWLLAELKGIE